MVCLVFALVVFLKWYVLCYRLLMQFKLFCYCPSWLRQLFQIFLHYLFRFESYFLYFDLTYDVFCQCPSWFFIFTAFWKLTINSFCILTLSPFSTLFVARNFVSWIWRWFTYMPRSVFSAERPAPFQEVYLFLTTWLRYSQLSLIE